MMFCQILESLDHHVARITNADKDFGQTLDYEDINF